MTKQEVIDHLVAIGGFDTSYSYENMKSCIEQVFNEFEAKIQADKDMVEWMEKYSNSSLCDYYNR